ncbi:cell surface receptor IPT/TIG domain-containing protein [Thecamonas trahens ATCC 50062]|uniref:Cell surface receptor IPT/TIG domain-containing protein n=1 Tax=Thecamonas trahens ATCC 50062 TaxID=461836 RepID=A0A0L0D3Z6_THETB|nr:cell surface receptor IPT/TIG domain-containing protein [Thecamonas trahens ATCC 50062]KNC46970.1 cell surface receptor IPT/TIG domain-containing protein [Thecamonas trahens ATCC 50062]|eukprot:XP_013760241.1 cell surface receptor IPT/TIG domain-containing protein [Thecamonas trahens ATCC 50062]
MLKSNRLDNRADDTVYVYLATGTYSFDTALALPSYTFVQGGYEPAAWSRTNNPDTTVLFRSSLNVDGNASYPYIAGLIATDASHFELHTLRLQVADAPASSAAGVTIYGIRLEACSDYTFTRVRVVTGAASSGAPGTAGAPGLPGLPGLSGGNGTKELENAPGLGGTGGAGAGVYGGTAGVNSTAGSMQLGTNMTQDGMGGGGGGSGGPAGWHGADGGASPLGGPGGVGGTAGPPGGTGGVAVDGVSGAAGDEGGVSAQLPIHAAGFYFPGGRGANGTAGYGGEGGSGGGGGGGFRSTNITVFGAGSGGGGGGGGGQGGYPGTGGFSGGGNFAVYVFNNGANGVFRMCSLEAGPGGTGGVGGPGGAGGAGGDGGIGGVFTGDATVQYVTVANCTHWEPVFTCANGTYVHDCPYASCCPRDANPQPVCVGGTPEALCHGATWDYNATCAGAADCCLGNTTEACCSNGTYELACTNGTWSTPQDACCYGNDTATAACCTGTYGLNCSSGAFEYNATCAGTEGCCLGNATAACCAGTLEPYCSTGVFLDDCAAPRPCCSGNATAECCNGTYAIAGYTCASWLNTTFVPEETVEVCVNNNATASCSGNIVPEQCGGLYFLGRCTSGYVPSYCNGSVVITCNEGVEYVTANSTFLDVVGAGADGGAGGAGGTGGPGGAGLPGDVANVYIEASAADPVITDFLDDATPLLTIARDCFVGTVYLSQSNISASAVNTTAGEILWSVPGAAATYFDDAEAYPDAIVRLPVGTEAVYDINLGSFHYPSELVVGPLATAIVVDGASSFDGATLNTTACITMSLRVSTNVASSSYAWTVTGPATVTSALTGAPYVEFVAAALGHIEVSLQVAACPNSAVHGISVLALDECDPICNAPACSIEHGACVAPNTCACDIGYDGADCSALIADYCPLLATPDGGTFGGACTTSIGGSCGPFQCDVGRKQIGFAVDDYVVNVTCKAHNATHGKWSQDIVCPVDESFCPYLAPAEGGTFASFSRRLGQVLDMTCRDGYHSLGVQSTACVQGASRALGVWSNASLVDCTPRDGYCTPLPPPQFGNLNECGHRVDDTCGVFYCDVGYELDGPTSRTCTAFNETVGLWSGNASRCTNIECEQLVAPVNGRLLSCPSRTYRDVCSYDCDDGFILVGDITRTCLASGSWSSTPAICAISTEYCPDLEADPHGTLGACNRSIAGQCGVFGCNTGYYLVGSPTLSCLQGSATAGNWSAPTPVCKPLPNWCPALAAPANGDLQPPTGCVPEVDRICASFSCNSGYDIIGATSRTCLVTGNWTGSHPVCVAQDCGPLIPPVAGYLVDGCTNTTFPSVCHYGCNQYYSLIGDASRTCQPGPVWSLLPPTCQDVTRPFIDATIPLANAVDVAVESNVTVVFSEPMNASSVEAAFSLSAGIVASFPGSFTWITPRLVVFDPAQPLAEKTSFVVTVSTHARDATGGLAFANVGSFAFKTIDLTPPQVSFTIPTRAKQGVPVGDDIEIAFNEAIDPSSVTLGSSLIVEDEASVGVGGYLTWSAGNTRVALTPTSNLTFAHRYDISLLTTIRDVSGNFMAAPFASHFFTVDNGPPSVINMSPPNGAPAVSLAASILITFSEPMSLSKTENAVSVKLDGVTPVSGSAFWLSLSVLQWTPSGLVADRDYTITISADAQDESSYPLSPTWASSFHTIDNIPPVMQWHLPVDDAGPLSISSTVVTLAFNEPMNTTTFPPAFSLSDADARVVPGSFAWTGNNSVVTFTPSALLAQKTTHYVAVSAGAHDVSGNSLAPSFFQFTTEDIDGPVVVSVAPANASANVAVTTLLVVTFDEALNVSSASDAATLACRDVGGDGPWTPLPHIAAFSLGGARLGIRPAAGRPLVNETLCRLVFVRAALTDAIGNAMAPGPDLVFTWETQDITAPTVISMTPADAAISIPVTANVSIVFSERMDVASADSALTVARIDGSSFVPISGSSAWSSDLTRLTWVPDAPLSDDASYRTTVAGGTAKDVVLNSLAATAVATFRTVDLTPPTVVSVSLADGTIGVMIEELEPASASGTFVWSDVNRVLTYTPGGDHGLRNLTRHCLQVTGEATDVSLNRLLGSPPVDVCFITLDVTAPRVTSVAPPDTAELVHPTTAITLAFNEAMETSSVAAALLVSYLPSGGGPRVTLPGTLTWASLANVSATFVPATVLPNLEVIDIALDATTAVNSAGIPLETNFAAAFTTLRAVPTLGAVAPTGVVAGSVVTVTGTGFLGATCADLHVRGEALAGTATVVRGSPNDEIRGCTVAPGLAAEAGLELTLTLDSLAAPANLTLDVYSDVVAVSPSSGPPGAAIMVTGSGFHNVASCAAVTVDGVPASGSPSVLVGGTRLDGCTVPMSLGVGTVGRVSVSAGSLDAAARAGAVVPSFTVVPQLVSMSPDTGDQNTIFNVTGSGLAGADCSSVLIDGVAASGTPSAASGSLLAGCAVPQGLTSTRVGAVAVAFNAVTSGTGAGVTFTYEPMVVSVTPAAGMTGQAFTLVGASLGGITCGDIVFGAVAASGGPASVSAAGAGLFAVTGCSVPSAVVGTVADVRVTLDGLSSATGSVSFVYAATISRIAPTSGPVGTAVSIIGYFGTGLPLNSISLGGLLCSGAGVAQSGATVLLGCVAPSAGSGSVAAVSAVVGNVAAVVDGPAADVSFKYVPAVTSVMPSSAAAGTAVDIVGIGFGPDAVVDLDGLSCNSSVVVTFTRISGCVVPALSFASGRVVSARVTSGGEAASGALTILPGLVSISPKLGPTGTAVTLTGTGLAGTGLSVSIGGYPCAVSSAGLDNSYGILTGCTMPLGPNTGTSQVVQVTVNGVTSVETSVTFFYVDIPALLDSVPQSGPQAGGTNVYIFASPPFVFLDSPALGIKFESVAASRSVVDRAASRAGGLVDLRRSSITFVSESILQFTLPAFPTTRAVTLSVTNDGFNYAPPLMFTYFSTPVQLVLVRPLPSAYDNAGALEALLQPAIGVGDASGAIVVNDASVQVPIMLQVVREADSELVTLTTGTSATTEADGVATFYDFSFVGLRNESYRFEFTTAAGFAPLVVSGVRVMSCGESRNYSVAMDNRVDCQCGLGYEVASVAGEVKCQPCSSRGYKDFVGDGGCLECPINKFTTAGARGARSDCHCGDGWYLPSSEPAGCADCVCRRCVRGGNCTSGAIVPLAGFWRASRSQNDVILECDEVDACVGGASEACAAEYTGPLCGVCRDSYAKFGDNCLRCPSVMENMAILVAIAIVFIGFILFLIKSALLSWKSQKSISAAVFKIMINFLQTVAFLGDFRTRWPNTLRVLFGMASSSNGFSTRFFSIQCAFGWSFFDSVLVAMLVPLFVVTVPTALLCGNYYVRKCVGSLKTKRWKVFSRRIWVSVLVLIFFTHPSVTSTVLEVFACRNIDGVAYLAADMSLACYTASHVRWMIAAGVFFVVYVVGVPVGGVFLLWRQREVLHTAEGRRRYAFLVSGFLPNRYYWEMVILVRKSAIITIKVLLKTNPVAQVYAAVWVVALALFVHMKASPFAFSILTSMEMLSLVVTFVILMASQLYYADELGGSDTVVVNSPFHSVLTIFLVLLLLGSTGYMLAVAARQKLRKMRHKLPRVVWWICRLDGVSVAANRAEAQSAAGAVAIKKAVAMADLTYSEYDDDIIRAGAVGVGALEQVEWLG